MATPTPTPTPAQIVTVAEMMQVSADGVLAILSAGEDQDIIDAKWAATLANIAEWGAVGTSATDLKRVDTIEFFENADILTRSNITNTVRSRYGLSVIDTRNARYYNSQAVGVDFIF